MCVCERARARPQITQSRTQLTHTHSHSPTTILFLYAYNTHTTLENTHPNKFRENQWHPIQPTATKNSKLTIQIKPKSNHKIEN